ncbi:MULTISPECIES: hypothetical protein [Aeromicrobium]|nr:MULTISPECIES: hypothetical protein [Aeromicrobium]
MIVIGILVGAVSVVGIAKTLRLVSNDGYGHVPERTYPHMFSIR